ncbi:MAG: SUMF1/EgtB/PvdO family nonheme iron enzyme [Bacteroidetes bacterium]|nr:SUMF1/EgtB/PvdO family nonheme iron enzyme [Bacteroidota bacterium]
MKKLLVVCLFSFGVFSSLKANNIAVSNVTLQNRNTISDYVSVAFNLSWENSFRNSSGTGNWDAAWVFVKYKIGSTGEWKHATLSTTGHSIPSGGTSTQTDAAGIFLYRNATGNGAFTLTGVELRWEYGTDGVPDESKIYVKVFAIEMVYIPQGSFQAGSSGQNVGEFRQADDVSPSGTASTFTITGSAPTLQGNNAGSSSSNLSTRNGIGNDQGTTTNTASFATGYPTGYNAFYCMKYEISQGQYRDFLNLLTYSQQSGRTINAPSSSTGTGALTTPGNFRNGIEISTSGISGSLPAIYGCDLNNNNTYNESDDGEWIACNYLSWDDVAAYLDWAGLRPITELEYEKVCRGTLPSVAEEYSWGDNTLIAITAVNNIREGSESSNTTNANANYNNQFTLGPVRAGLFATNSTNRISAGSSYYGVMEMSGNLWEQMITIGNSTGRSFTGLAGNGILDSNGFANTANWPNYTGTGLRGGSWLSLLDQLKTSDRNAATQGSSTRTSESGGRGGR